MMFLASPPTGLSQTKLKLSSKDRALHLPSTLKDIIPLPLPFIWLKRKKMSACNRIQNATSGTHAGWSLSQFEITPSPPSIVPSIQTYFLSPLKVAYGETVDVYKKVKYDLKSHVFSYSKPNVNLIPDCKLKQPSIFRGRIHNN